MSNSILVIEDNDDIRSAITESLDHMGFAAFGARNGQEGLDYLDASRGSTGLIILDLSMPGMNGWEFRAKQLASPAHAAIPVIVVSADLNIRDEAEWLGAKGILRKPFLIEELFSQASRFCQPLSGQKNRGLGR